MAIVVNLDVMMARRKMSLNELSQRVDITLANLSILKNNKARGGCASPPWRPSARPWTASRGIFWNMSPMKKRTHRDIGTAKSRGLDIGRFAP